METMPGKHPIESLQKQLY